MEALPASLEVPGPRSLHGPRINGCEAGRFSCAPATTTPWHGLFPPCILTFVKSFTVPLLAPEFEGWYCPNCPVTDRVRTLPPGASRFHTCSGLHGLIAPLIREGIHAAVIAEEREDYLNGEIQRTGDDGKPYMAVRTLRDDGEDVAVNAGLAHAELRS